MVFSSIVFIAYFLPILLLVYFLADKKYKNYILLAGSIIFYSWGAPKFIFVLLFTTFLDFHLVKWMSNAANNKTRRLLLIISVGINIGLLFYFKYCNFFIDNANQILAGLGLGKVPLLKVIMPIGISFYTFETITYVVDVYRKVHSPLKKFRDYLLYIILFPKLIAGPIIRYHDLADQINDRADKIDDKLHGFYRFVIGLSKKVIIANFMGEQADFVFGYDYASLGATEAWIGALLYTMQIYFDFSGYSDMAIGLGRMLGFKFPENFHSPYTATSITDFWRRWHITLGSWMRNYLYIPLGGNKTKRPWMVYINLLIVFIASGFWHGASWTFLFWGIYHGSFIVLERLFLQKIYNKIGKYASMVITFIIVVIGWVPFKLDSMVQTKEYYRAMIRFSKPYEFRWDYEFYFYLCMALFFAFFAATKWGEKIQDYVYKKEFGNGEHVMATMVSLGLMILCISFIAINGFNPFIYFRF